MLPKRDSIVASVASAALLLTVAPRVRIGATTIRWGEFRGPSPLRGLSWLSIRGNREHAIWPRPTRSMAARNCLRPTQRAPRKCAASSRYPSPIYQARVCRSHDFVLSMPDESSRGDSGASYVGDRGADTFNTANRFTLKNIGLETPLPEFAMNVNPPKSDDAAFMSPAMWATGARTHSTRPIDSH
jgi:hypothetical protein